MVDHTCASFVLHNFRLYHGDEYPLVAVGEDHPDLEDEIDFEYGNEDDIEDEVGDIPDPFEEQNAAAVVNQRKVRGEQRRWNLCNSL
ncbi:hypothetical protein FOCC_FOCC014300 [Frankliniella occidentalis]|nr:hypothetical protein FOCC_FOCC014300 [Frankliniella occidentalis]